MSGIMFSTPRSISSSETLCEAIELKQRSEIIAVKSAFCSDSIRLPALTVGFLCSSDRVLTAFQWPNLSRFLSTSSQRAGSPRSGLRAHADSDESQFPGGQCDLHN
jgi:hypothetical protein